MKSDEVVQGDKAHNEKKKDVEQLVRKLNKSIHIKTNQKNQPQNTQLETPLK